MAFLAIVGGILLVNAWWWWSTMRRVRRIPLARPVLTLVQLALAGQILWMLVDRQSALRAHQWVPVSLIAASYVWNLAVIPVLGAFLVGGWVADLVRPAAEADPGPRRRFLCACVAAGPPLLAAAGAGLALPRLGALRVRRLEVGLRGLPARLDGATIAHVSDLHVGKFSSAESLQRAIGEINGLQADLVLFTGDLIDLSLADLPRAVEVMRALDPRQGLFLCEGNHDLIDDGEEFRRRVRAAKLPLLLDEAETVELNGTPVQVLGQRWGARPPAHLRSRQAFPILLAHHPHAFDGAFEFPLTLSGHTHGGQLMLNEHLGAGPVLFRYWSGPYEDGNRRLVVSNGAGNWFPLRLNAPAEILHLTLSAVG